MNPGATSHYQGTSDTLYELDDVSTIKKHRKQVARINTELRAREIAAHEELEKQRENA